MPSIAQDWRVVEHLARAMSRAEQVAEHGLGLPRQGRPGHAAMPLSVPAPNNLFGAGANYRSSIPGDRTPPTPTPPAPSPSPSSQAWDTWDDPHGRGWLVMARLGGDPFLVHASIHSLKDDDTARQIEELRIENAKAKQVQILESEAEAERVRRWAEDSVRVGDQNADARRNDEIWPPPELREEQRKLMMADKKGKKEARPQKKKHGGRRLARTRSGDLGTAAAKRVLARERSALSGGEQQPAANVAPRRNISLFKPSEDFSEGSCFILFDSKPLQSFRERSVGKVIEFDDQTGEVHAALWRLHAPTKLDGSIHVAASGQSQSKTGPGLRTITSEIVFTLGDKGKHLEEYEFFESEPVLVDHILNVSAAVSLFPQKSLTRSCCNIDGASANAATSRRIEWRASDLQKMQRRPDAHLPASGLGAHYSPPPLPTRSSHPTNVHRLRSMTTAEEAS